MVIIVLVLSVLVFGLLVEHNQVCTYLSYICTVQLNLNFMNTRVIVHALHEYEIFATCLHALDSLMTYELLASNINARCVHTLLMTRVHSTRGTHEEFVYIKLFHKYLPSNVTSKSHFLKIVLVHLCAILFLLVNACHVCTRF